MGLKSQFNSVNHFSTPGFERAAWREISNQGNSTEFPGKVAEIHQPGPRAFKNTPAPVPCT